MEAWDAVGQDNITGTQFGRFPCIVICHPLPWQVLLTFQVCLCNNLLRNEVTRMNDISFFFHWHYSPLWAWACRTMSFHCSLSATNSLHLLTPSTWRSLLLPLSIFSWVFPFFSSLPVLEWRSFWASYPPPFSVGDLTSLSFALLSSLPYFFPLLISCSSQFIQHFRSPFSYLGSYILLNIFLSKISRACSSFFVNIHASAPYDTTSLISVLYNIILVALDKSRQMIHQALLKYWDVFDAVFKYCLSVFKSWHLKVWMTFSYDISAYYCYSA